MPDKQQGRHDALGKNYDRIMDLEGPKAPKKSPTKPGQMTQGFSEREILYGSHDVDYHNCDAERPAFRQMGESPDNDYTP